MAKVKNNTRVVTNEVRLHYVHLAEPYSYGTGDGKYSTVITFPKSDGEMLECVKQAVDNAIGVGMEKFGKNFRNAKTHLPLHDGDEEKPNQPEFAGCYYLNCSNKYAPNLWGPDKKPLKDASEIYSGCYAKLGIRFAPYSNNGTGVTVLVENVMKTRDGESMLGNRVSAADDFGAPDDKDDFLS